MMLTLEDAVKVAKRLFDFDPEDEKWVRSEFEQKCYLGSRDPKGRLIEMFYEINPKSICLEIEKDSLTEWCERIRAELEMAYTTLSEVVK